jgi:hypothetical protein
MKRYGQVLAAFVLCLALASCSDETEDKVREAARSAGRDVDNAIDATAAAAAAEAMRGVLMAKDLPDGKTVRHVDVLTDAAGELPGDPTVTSIEDGDGDGKDDDGKVGIVVGGQRACLTVQDNGEIDVSNDAC